MFHGFSRVYAPLMFLPLVFVLNQMNPLPSPFHLKDYGNGCGLEVLSIHALDQLLQRLVLTMEDEMSCWCLACVLCVPQMTAGPVACVHVVSTWSLRRLGLALMGSCHPPREALGREDQACATEAEEEEGPVSPQEQLVAVAEEQVSWRRLAWRFDLKDCWWEETQERELVELEMELDHQ